MNPLQQVTVGSVFVEPPHDWQVLALATYDDLVADLLVHCLGCGEKRTRRVPVEWCELLIEELQIADDNGRSARWDCI